MEGLDNALRRLAGPLAAAGVLLLLAAGAQAYINRQADRVALTMGAVGLALVVFYALERFGDIVDAASGRTARYGANSLLMTVAFIGIVALLNVLANRYSYRVDLTENQSFTLSSQTVEILSSIQEPVQITAFYSARSSWLQPQRQELEGLLKAMQHQNRNVQYEFVDTDLQPGLAREMGIDTDGTTVIAFGGKRQLIRGSSERELATALVKLIRPPDRKVYFVVGHGELDPESLEQVGASEAKRRLEAEGYTVDRLLLASTGSVPEDAAAIIVAAPERPLPDNERQAILDYLDRQGNALILATPGRIDPVNPLIEQFGVKFTNGVALDPGQSLAGDPRAPAILDYTFSPITRSMNGRPTFFPLAASIEVPEDRQSNAQVLVLAETSEMSWLETDQQTARFDDGQDRRGPLPLVATITVPAQPAQGGGAEAGTDDGRIVLVANADFATNVGMSLGFNSDLFLNMVNWLTEDESLIGIREKPTPDQPLLLTDQQWRQAAIAVFGLPLVVLGIGVVVYRRRR